MLSKQEQYIKMLENQKKIEELVRSKNPTRNFEDEMAVLEKSQQSRNQTGRPATV